MKIGLLMAGINSGAIAEKYGEYEQQFIDMFALVHTDDMPPLEWKIYNVWDGDLPKSAAECDAYLISGSKYGVYDDDPWMQGLAKFIREIVAANKRLTGVCFGHQIIAHAMGGEVVKVDKGFGIGWHDYKIMIPSAIVHLARDYKFDLTLKTQFSVNISHADQVVKLPDSAEIIASSEFCEIAGLYYPEGILTFQGHPEFDNQFIKELIEFKWSNSQGWITKTKIDDALSVNNLATDRLPIAKFMLNFMTEGHR
ncbi:MAG: type 1 glutamine amidotransferase [Rhizobiales bacterium]|nr:type 1 glutamine amidotransferase [Hyphomicrobiales bacterium]NRB14565.1 type 1 glutamine amidotransferase [Hyphomicrobiales bacterium]